MRITQGAFSFLPDLTDAQIGQDARLPGCLTATHPNERRLLPADSLF